MRLKYVLTLISLALIAGGCVSMQPQYKDIHERVLELEYEENFDAAINMLDSLNRSSYEPEILYQEARCRLKRSVRKWNNEIDLMKGLARLKIAYDRGLNNEPIIIMLLHYALLTDNSELWENTIDKLDRYNSRYANLWLGLAQNKYIQGWLLNPMDDFVAMEIAEKNIDKLNQLPDDAILSLGQLIYYVMDLKRYIPTAFILEL